MAQRERRGPDPQQDDRTEYRFVSTPSARQAFKLRMGLCGAGGSGKSYSALAIASHIATRLGVTLYGIDSENGSMLKYARSKRTGRGFDFMHTPLSPHDYSPQAYHAAIDHCLNEGAGIILIDSLSHEWEGPNGVLEQVDAITEGVGPRASAFSNGWKVMSPIHARLIQHMLSCDAHVIFTLRAKVKYEMKKGADGKTKPEKTGEGPVQKGGIEYEPDVFAWLDNSILTVDKTRCDTIEPRSAWPKPGADFANALVDWVQDVDTDPLTVALDEAVTSGALAAEERSPEKYKAASAGLLTWCKTNGVPAAKYEWAAQQFKERVAAAVGPKTATQPGDAAEPAT